MTRICAYNTAGGSMRPYIYPGNVVIAQTDAKVQAGDFIVYQAEGKNYCHLIKKIISEEEFFVTDTTGTICQIAVKKEQVLGRVVGVENKFGNIFFQISRNFRFLYQIVRWVYILKPKIFR